MNIEITYIFHNCFVIKFPGRTFLFDYPGPEYENALIRATVVSLITGSDLYVFASHFHHDHFNRNIAELGSKAAKVRYVLSKDILKRNSGFRDNPACLTAAPDQTYPLDEMTVTTFRSNDEGVAFLLQAAGWSLYFGGDLADWAWADNNRREKQLLEEYFAAVLLRIQKLYPAGQPLDIAFSNADARLSNWSGAAQVMETLQPRLFVPMHTFGKTDTLSRFVAEHPHIKTPVFQYQKTGERAFLEVGPPTA